MTTTLTALEELYGRLAGARTAEEAFGDLGVPQGEGLRRRFLERVRVAHPDRCPGEKALAEKTFALLVRWREAAQERIDRGVYGNPRGTGDAKVIRGPRGVYRVQEPESDADYATVYACESERARGLTFKITRDPRDNPLGQQEVRALQALQGSAGCRYFPTLVDAFQADDGAGRRQAVIYGTGGARHTLREIRAAYPGGVDPRDAAWMFNRLLEGLYHVHAGGLVHGAVVPANVRVDIESHSLVLTEWGYSVNAGERLTAISAAHEAWYPPEVFARRSATAATDLYMAAKCLAYVVADAAPFEHYIRGCLLPNAARRPADAGALREEFGELLNALYGRPAFRPFVMPA